MKLGGGYEGWGNSGATVGKVGVESLHSVHMYETPQRIQLKDGRKICQLADR